MEKRVRKKWGAIEVRLTPVDISIYDALYIDAFSVAAALRDEEELFRSAAVLKRAVMVLDAWHESHVPLVRRYLELCRRYILECRLSEQKPAEEYAAELCELECGGRCAVVTRDFDVFLSRTKCDVVIFQRGRLWRAEIIKHRM